jgi:hypothetical protein
LPLNYTAQHSRNIQDTIFLNEILTRRLARKWACVID